LEDAIALARAFVKHARPEAALAEFELERQPVVERLQEASRVSCDYFQSLRRYFTFEPLQFAYQLMTRTPRVTHTGLTLRDADFVRRVEARFMERCTGRPAFAAPPPAFAPLQVRSVTLPNRLVLMGGPPVEAAALAAAELGHRLLLLDCARGGLLASFVSPLSNRREDEHGGTLENRMRFPVEVVAAVREAWPQELPLAVAYSAADHLRGGLTP